MTDTAMIFAAGRGTRMGALTAKTPKPLIEVAGRALIDHAFALLEESPIRRTVVNVHHLSEQIAKHLEGRDTQISHETDALLETGGGLKKALNLLNSATVVTLNADAVWTGPNPINALLQRWDPSKMDALLMLVDPSDAVAHKGKGDFLQAENGTLTRGPGMTYTGCQIIKTAFVADVPENVFSLNLVWDRLIANGRAFGMRHEGRWCDVGHPEGIIAAERMLEDADV